jgi:ABC-2 type transport system ATP-binding protein
MIVADYLGKRFGDFWAVRSFYVRVARGEVVAVLGPNGVGKTTTIRMLASLLRPTRGVARVIHMALMVVLILVIGGGGV